MKLTDFAALSFDCYGTLIDWESGMVEPIAPAQPFRPGLGPGSGRPPCLGILWHAEGPVVNPSPALGL